MPNHFLRDQVVPVGNRVEEHIEQKDRRAGKAHVAAQLRAGDRLVLLRGNENLLGEHILERVQNGREERKENAKHDARGAGEERVLLEARDALGRQQQRRGRQLGGRQQGAETGERETAGDGAHGHRLGPRERALEQHAREHGGDGQRRRVDNGERARAGIDEAKEAKGGGGKVEHGEHDDAADAVARAPGEPVEARARGRRG